MKNLIVYLSPFDKACEIIKYSEQVAIRLKLNIHFIFNIDSEIKNIPDKNSENISKEEIEKKIIEDKKYEIGQRIEEHEWTSENIIPVYSVFKGSFKDMFETLASRNHSELVLFPINGNGMKFNEKVIYQILDTINLPVWCFSVNKEFRQIKTIVYGTDYKKEDIDVIKSLTSMAREFEAKINILHVFKSEKFKQQLVNAGLKDFIDRKIEYPGIEIHSKKKRNVVKGIADFSKTSFADLVVLLKKDKYFFQDLLRKSTIEKVLKKVDLPILIYKK